MHNSALSKMVEGEKIILFNEGKFKWPNMNKAIISEKEVMQGVRKSALTEDLDNIQKVFIEPNGEITAVNKNIQH